MSNWNATGINILSMIPEWDHLGLHFGNGIPENIDCYKLINLELKMSPKAWVDDRGRE